MAMLSIDLNKTYSFSDYLSWNDEKRYELINGKVHEMSPAPTPLHQRVVGGFFYKIMEVLRKKKNKCEVYTAPFDVRLPSIDNSDDKINTVVQPDISVICDSSKIDDKGCLGPPDLIVEVLSKKKIYDVEEKFQLYEKSGVKEYWIVHPEEETVTVFRRGSSGKYEFQKMLSFQNKLKIGIFENIEIDLSDMFGNE
jgi:Uma2 family endonuclease